MTKTTKENLIGWGIVLILIVIVVIALVYLHNEKDIEWKSKLEKHENIGYKDALEGLPPLHTHFRIEEFVESYRAGYIKGFRQKQREEKK